MFFTIWVFMSSWNYLLSWVEHETCLITAEHALGQAKNVWKNQTADSQFFPPKLRFGYIHMQSVLIAIIRYKQWWSCSGTALPGSVLFVSCKKGARFIWVKYMCCYCAKSSEMYQKRNLRILFYSFSAVLYLSLNFIYFLYNNMCTYNTRSSNTGNVNLFLYL